MGGGTDCLNVVAEVGASTMSVDMVAQVGAVILSAVGMFTAGDPVDLVPLEVIVLGLVLPLPETEISLFLPGSPVNSKVVQERQDSTMKANKVKESMEMKKKLTGMISVLRIHRPLGSFQPNGACKFPRFGRTIHHTFLGELHRGRPN